MASLEALKPLYDLLNLIKNFCGRIFQITQVHFNKTFAKSHLGV